MFEEELEAIAKRLADEVMKVKSEFDRIGGLYEMAYKGALAGLRYRWTD